MSTCVCCGRDNSLDFFVIDRTEGEVCNDCDDIIHSAFVAISAARQIGVPKYGPSSWRDDKEHINKGFWHIVTLQEDDEHLFDEPISPYSYEPNEDHLSHAICRLAMAKALQ